MRKVFNVFALFFIGLLAGCCGPADQPAAEEEYSKIITARLFIEPEHVDEFIELFSELTELTLQEPGCTGYELFQDPDDPSRFLVFETYVNQAAVEAHFAAPYFAEYGEKIGRLASRPAEIVVFDVAGETRQ